MAGKYLEYTLLIGEGMRTPSLHAFTLLSALLSLVLLAGPAYSTNSLSIWSEGTHGTFPGYIDEATAVVEPKAGFAAVSLFLNYADHGQFLGRKVEVIHLFELPEGASVHDLWLWIGDSIMQARVFETPRAQQIYDSIVSLKKDPAFLKLKNGQYELHIYPLASGSYRKIKLTYLAPLAWAEGKPRVPLPMRMLQAAGAPLKPLRLLYRSLDPGTESPALVGSVDAPFKQLPDTLGYRYFEALVPDITGLPRLDIVAPALFPDGISRSTHREEGAAYASFGIIPKDFFGLDPSGARSRKVLVGLDLSGLYGPTPEQLTVELEKIVPSAFFPGDSLKIVAAGGGVVEAFPPAAWAPVSALASLKADFSSGAVAHSNGGRNRQILVTDPQARHCWGFNDLEKLGRVTYSTSNSIMSYLDRFREAQVIASLTQGYEEGLSDEQARRVLDSLQVFFEMGGTFLTYLDFNRGNEKIARALIRGLQAPSGWNNATTLHSIPSSPIGRGLPSSLSHRSHFVLKHEDPDATTEMVDGAGRPVVVSKAISKGRIVVSGIWSLQDADGTKKALALPMLGLQNRDTLGQMDALMARIAEEHGRSRISKVILFGNSDIARTPAVSETIANGYMGRFASQPPVFDAVHLQDGQIYLPLSVNAQGRTYLGNALVLKTLAEKSSGRSLSLQTSSWEEIREGLRVTDYPPMRTFSLSATTLPGGQTVDGILDLPPSSWNPELPRYFVARTPPAESLALSFQATFTGSDSVHRGSATLALKEDKSEFGTFLKALLAKGQIDSLLRKSPLDTQAIIRLAMRERLVTDYTALLALEPNDTLRFMSNPRDESKIGNPVTGTKPLRANAADTLGLAYSYSPLAKAWRFTVTTPSGGHLEAAFFDGLGRRIREWRTVVRSSGTLVYEMGTGNEVGGAPLQGFALVRFAPAPNTGLKVMVKAGRFRR